MSTLLLSAHRVGKAFARVHRSQDRLRALASLLVGRAPPDPIWVLRDVDLEVHRGQSLGLIGENGAGKSTLLKLLCGVWQQTAGRIQRHGSIGALLELGAGFHPELSGRENIALAAALHGFDAKAAKRKAAEIIEFADIGQYIDEPIKHYSSGMVVRLGFAIVAATRPDVLITDEVLAVGDESFQRKCVQWISDYVADGGTLLLVSHSVFHVQKLCRQALWLRQGRVEARGDVFEVTQAYLSYHERKLLQEQQGQRQAGGYRLIKVLVNGCEAGPVCIDAGADLLVEIDVKSDDQRMPQVAVGLARSDHSGIFGVHSDMDQASGRSIAPDQFRYRLCLPALALLPGHYVVKAHVLDPEGVRLFDTEVRELAVRGQARLLGVVDLPRRWLD